jgi:hypothetical protein
MLDGKWTYRSYHNSSDLVAGDAEKALSLLFGEGVFEFTPVTYVKFNGSFDMGGNYKLDLEAELHPIKDSPDVEIAITGRGIAGTPTDGWQYDYRGTFGHRWDDGIDQVPSFVGTVIRTKPHGSAPAGYVASFIAVRHTE